MYIHIIIHNWLVVSTPLKNMKVTWDYYSQDMESHKFMFQTTNQYNIHTYPIKKMVIFHRYVSLPKGDNHG